MISTRLFPNIQWIDPNVSSENTTMEQFREDEQSVKDAILEDLQEMFGSDFIVGVSFSSVNTQ